MIPSRTLSILVLTGILGSAATACSGSSGGTASGPAAEPTAAAPRYTLVSPTGAANPTLTSTDPADPAALRYTKIVEPFSAPGDCDNNGSTIEITACVLEQIVDVDSTVDQLQLTRFESAPAGEQAQELAEFARWLKGRSTSCAAGANGGSIDQIAGAECLLKASQERVETLNDAG